MPRPQGPVYKSVSCGMYAELAPSLVRVGLRCPDRRTAVERICRRLPQNSPLVRRRVANAMVRRYLTGSDGSFGATPLARLLTGVRDARTRLDLVHYGMQCDESLVAAVARQVFYPYFIRGKYPGGMTRQEFLLRDGARLFESEPVITRSFVEQFAGEQWGVSSPDAIQRALRALAQADLIRARRLPDERYHPYAFHPQRRDISLVAFVFCIHVEFASAPRCKARLRELQNSQLARSFLLHPDYVRDLVRRATRYRWLSAPNLQSAATVRLAFTNLDACVEALLDRGV